jgi:hypothetical protein
VADFLARFRESFQKLFPVEPIPADMRAILDEMDRER